jgi:thiol:disulfide interchange protein DsbG
MFSLPAQRACAMALLVAAGGAHAKNIPLPAAVKALQAHGITIVDEFKIGGGLRAFAGHANDQPIAVYLTSDGKAIVGTRLDAKGETVDDAALQRLVAKPMDEKAWRQLGATRWVLDGQAQAPRVVYTFSDANCPYCNRFWTAARPWVDAGKVQIRHVLVGIIRQDSPTKAAAILGAADRSAALHENETRFAQGGIQPASSVPADIAKLLDEHQDLMRSLGFKGTPGIVVQNQDGSLRKFGGMPSAAALADVLGPL